MYKVLVTTTLKTEYGVAISVLVIECATLTEGLKYESNINGNRFVSGGAQRDALYIG